VHREKSRQMTIPGIASYGVCLKLVNNSGPRVHLLHRQYAGGARILKKEFFKKEFFKKETLQKEFFKKNSEKSTSPKRCANRHRLA
jgi:hypothetical protein